MLRSPISPGDCHKVDQVYYGNFRIDLIYTPEKLLQTSHLNEQFVAWCLSLPLQYVPSSPSVSPGQDGRAGRPDRGLTADGSLHCTRQF